MVAVVGEPTPSHDLPFSVAVRNLEMAVAGLPTVPPVSERHAAVLVPLFEDPSTGGAHVILTQRASGMRTHAGEVSFPGGKREAGDASDTCTALREAQEELGMDPTRVRVLGCLPALLSKHLLSVTPVLGTIRAHQAFHPNPDEVARVFACPLRMFLEAGPNHSFHDTTLAGTKPYRVHYFQHKIGDQEYCIWGLTAAMLIDVASKAYGLPPEFEPYPPGFERLEAKMFPAQRMR